jgi:hypothetical protein
MPVTPPEKRREPRLTAEMLTKAESSLQELDLRLLHWLLRYPLQRVDDLVVGVARWASRPTVYRHLQGLEANGFVESVLPKTPGEGKRLYHLSNLGLHLVQTLKRDQPAIWPASGRPMKRDCCACCRVFPRCWSFKRW